MGDASAVSRPQRISAAVVVVASLAAVLSLTGLPPATAAAGCSISSVATGAWSNPGTWSSGVVPARSDVVCVTGQTTVTLDEAAEVDSLTVQSGGTLVVPPGEPAVLDLADASTVALGGQLQLQGGQIGDAGAGSLSDNGSMVVSDDATLGVPLTVTGGLTVNAALLTETDPLSSSGTIAVLAGGTLDARKGFSQSGAASSSTLTGASSELLVGSAGATVTGGTMSGNGSIVGNGGLTMSGGTLQPGGPAGRSLTVTGPYDQEAAATLAETLGGTAATTVNLEADVSLDGTLAVTPVGGSLTAGSTYPVLAAAGTVSGGFDTVQRNGNAVLPASSATLDYVMQYPTDSGTVGLLAVGAPGQPRSVATTPTYDDSVGQELVTSWQPPASSGGAPLSGYQVTVAVASGGSSVYDVPVASTSFTATGDGDGLLPLTSYSVTVAAENGHFGSSPAQSSGQTWGPPSPPAVAAFNGDTTDVTLTPPSATNGSAVTEYQAQAVQIGGNASDTISATWLASTAKGTVLTWPLGDLDPSKGYTISARALNQFGWSNWSNAVTMLPATLAAPASATIGYGRSMTLSTTLRSAGSPVPSARIELWSQSGVAAPSLVTSSTTNHSGVATASVKPTVTTSYFWELPGKASGAPVQYWSEISDAGTVSIRPLMTSELSQPTVKAPRKRDHVKTVFLSGWLSPLDAGAVVTLQRIYLGSWRTTTTTAKITRQQLPDGTTRVGFVLPIRVVRSSPHRLTSFRAVLAADDRYDAVVGTTLKLKIH